MFLGSADALGRGTFLCLLCLLLTWGRLEEGPGRRRRGRNIPQALFSSRVHELDHMVLRSILSVGRAIDEQGYCQVCGEQDGEDTFEETVLSSLPLIHEILAVCRQVAQEWNSCN